MPLPENIFILFYWTAPDTMYFKPQDTHNYNGSRS